VVGTEEGRLGAVACLAVTLVLGLAVALVLGAVQHWSHWKMHTRVAVLLAGAEEGCSGGIAAVACLAVALGTHSLPSRARPPQGGGISTHTSANSSHECRAIVTA
jgi:hypothetical protein